MKRCFDPVKSVIQYWIERHAQQAPGRPAMKSGGQTWTYAEMAERVRAVGGWLELQGLQPGAHIGLIGKNSPEYVILTHAILSRNMTVVPLNRRLALSELEYHARHTDCALVLADSELVDPSDFMSTECLPFSQVFQRVTESDPVDPLQLFARNVCALFTTSGTTGKPKGVMLTYENFYMSALASLLNLGHLSDDCWLGILPMDHIGGFSLITRTAIYGDTLVIPDENSPPAIVSVINREQITITSLVPTMLERILRTSPRFHDQLRCILLGGAPASQNLMKRAIEARLPVYRTYGMTETCSQIVTMPEPNTRENRNASGKPLPFTSLKIAAASGREAKQDEAGEILIASPTISPGYWKDRDLWTERFEEGWYATGDIGLLDDKGYLYVLGRKDEMIVTGGENVFPREVESVLEAHMAIAEACVTGIADPEWGQRIVAVVVLEENGLLSEEGLHALEFSSLARFKHPSKYLVVEALPRTSSGKLHRKAVCQIATDLLKRHQS